VWGIGIHHDAAPAGMSLENRCRYAWENAQYRPIGALWLHTDGRVMVGATGATNTQGMGGPYKTSRGTIPLNAGNRYVLSIEASNNGIGEVWPEAQQDAYVKMCRVLCDWLTLDPKTDVFAHFEWTSRKYDPAGPSRYAAGVTKWNMPAFRSDVLAYGHVPDEPTSGEDADMLKIDLNPGTPQWVSMIISATTITHIVDGYHAAVLDRAGIRQENVDQRELEGILRSLRATNASPFASGASANPTLNSLWTTAQQRAA
jgi:hypothetical protein